MTATHRTPRYADKRANAAVIARWHALAAAARAGLLSPAAAAYVTDTDPAAMDEAE